MSIECLDKFVINAVTSWMLSLGTLSMPCLKPLCTLPQRGKPRLGLFPALLYCHLLDVELRHNVDGLPNTTLYSTLTGKTTLEC